MKRYLALILAVFVIFALFSCDPAVDDTTDKGDDSSEILRQRSNRISITTAPKTAAETQSPPSVLPKTPYTVTEYALP